MANKKIGLIVGAGTGLSASLARKFSGAGMQIALASRDTKKLSNLVNELGAAVYSCDTSDPKSVRDLFSSVQLDLGDPEVVIFNASKRIRGEITEIDAEEVRDAILTTCYGGFLVGQEAAKIMQRVGSGTIMFTGASAGVKGFPKSATFAMGKFGLRGLAQSMARELHPQNIHVAHVVVDGGIHSEKKNSFSGEGEDNWLLPDAIADTYYHLHTQHRSAWTWEIEVRPWVENF
jgi:NAD(P)-dependent dehydrogenase (short-subunit alcohol dehydrogenase family)